MSDRPGLISTIGVVVAAVLLVGVLTWTLVEGPVLFSPGSLNAQARASTLGGVNSHAELAGDCGACHPAPWSSETLSDRCLDCHTKIGAEIDGGEGMHGRLAGTPSSPTCRGCHPEHNGPDGALTVLDAASFPHDATGFSLGTHERTADGDRFVCVDCHPRKYSPFDQAICTDCHAAIDARFMRRHEATYGSDCLPCHDGSGRDGAGFDHDSTAFKLTGKHAGVACADCHAGAESAQDLRATPHACYACHEKDDEHDGAYGRQCGECHTAADWGEVTFDHSIFPLDHGSEERTASCQTCHPDDVARYTCHGCHEHSRAKVLDQHQGKGLGELRDCVRCHPGGEAAGD